MKRKMEKGKKGRKEPSQSPIRKAKAEKAITFGE
jgi:hypothetical protein